MKPNFFLVLIFGLLFSACSNNNDDRASGVSKVQVKVKNFSITQEDIPNTRAAQAVADYNGVKAITVAFFKSDGTKQYESTQLRADNSTYDTFGSLYWIDLLHRNGYLNETQYKSIYGDCEELVKLLTHRCKKLDEKGDKE